MSADTTADERRRPRAVGRLPQRPPVIPSLAGNDPRPNTGPTAAWRHPAYRRYQFVRIATILGLQMQSVAVAWQVYDLTRRPLDLGYLGLVQFLPVLALWPITGIVVDRFDRRTVVSVGIVVYALAAAALAVMQPTTVTPLFITLAIVAAARAFGQPASQALLPHLVPPEDFTNAVTWTSSLFQLGTIVGPAIGGLMLGFVGVRGVYLSTAVLCTLAAVVAQTVQARPSATPGVRGPLRDEMLAGVRFVRSQPVVLGAITLDLFAVLLGGAVALLPVYARDIIQVGDVGDGARAVLFGVLRASPAFGATAMAIFLAFNPVGARAGRKMYAAVAVFGVATIAFGLSTNIWLSIIALAISGAADELSVVVRQTLIQINTPDAMRGRVSAVNFVFIGISNEVGELESGLAAAAIGTVPAVVVGGLGTLAVVAAGWVLAPALRDVDRLDRR